MQRFLMYGGTMGRRNRKFEFYLISSERVWRGGGGHRGREGEKERSEGMKGAR